MSTEQTSQILEAFKHVDDENPSVECYACTQAGFPVFHSTSCDRAHQPQWEASAGTSLVPIHYKHTRQTPNTRSGTSTGGPFGSVLDPRSKHVQRWNRAFVLARGMAMAVDPLFFYVLSIGRGGSPCLYFNAQLAVIVTVLRTCLDAVHLCHMCLQFRLAFVSRESLVVGCGKLVWDARAISSHYVRSVKGFWFDAFVILPIPQVVILLVVPRLMKEEEVTLIMSILELIFLFQFLPKVYHTICLMRRLQKVTGYIFGTIWWGFGINLIAYFIASHVFLLAVMAKKRKMQLRCRDMEWWMKRRQLPSQLRQRVRHYERHQWAAMGGQDEIELIKDLPEGLRRDIKRFLCLDLIKKVPLFHSLDDDLILDNICDRVKPLVFASNEKIIREGDPVQRIVFIVRGCIKRSQSFSKGMVATSVLEPGGFLGDELLSWCLRRPFIDRLPSSSATFTSLEPTEAFGLDAKNLRYITEHFRYKFASERLKRTTRYYSSYWRTWAAINIQLAWRRYMVRTRWPVENGGGGDRLRQYAAMFMSLKPHDHLE
ncbi:hypothetical protein LguiA_006317 [Lonicera macranthoides]